MTEKLFYKDSHMRSFDAAVISCCMVGDTYETELDRTAFFPEGGGQSADTGVLGGVKVLYTFNDGERIVHRTEGPLEPGARVTGDIDWSKRFKNMQKHTAEHILSGLVHGRFGYNNVGFHMGDDGVILDFDGYISPEELSEIEWEANKIVMENHPVRAYFPDEGELKNIKYRSKLELTKDVRIVEIAGCDVCACCAPHVSNTGEIGSIKIFESLRRKGGVRLRMLSGMDAYEDYCRKASSAAKISALLSAPQNGITEAVKHTIEQRDELSYALGGLKRELIALRTDRILPCEGNMVFFEPSFSPEELRLLVNSALPKCGGICAGFSGSDGVGYKYVMASSSCDLRAMSREINSAIAGRGGGKPEMISGSAAADEETIRKFFGEKQEV
ncbi:MAG: alanyl-tRNA editing protein [Oscillospiraceae bacterium]